jgi:hypothetical protein
MRDEIAMGAHSYPGAPGKDHGKGFRYLAVIDSLMGQGDFIGS